MDQIIEKINTNWNKNSKADKQSISTVESSLNFRFPDDYKAFLYWSNGGEGYVGRNYVSLWRIEDSITLNHEYQIQKYLTQNFFAFGTDGGGICYGFVINDGFAVSKCPFGDLDINEVLKIAPSFSDFIEKAFIEEY